MAPLTPRCTCLQMLTLAQTCGSPSGPRLNYSPATGWFRGAFLRRRAHSPRLFNNSAPNKQAPASSGPEPRRGTQAPLKYARRLFLQSAGCPGSHHATGQDGRGHWVSTRQDWSEAGACPPLSPSGGVACCQQGRTQEAGGHSAAVVIPLTNQTSVVGPGLCNKTFAPQNATYHFLPPILGRASRRSKTLKSVRRVLGFTAAAGERRQERGRWRRPAGGAASPSS